MISDHRQLDNISEKDRRVVQEAVHLDCEASMTMERRLLTRADFVERTTDLGIVRPTTYWVS